MLRLFMFLGSLLFVNLFATGTVSAAPQCYVERSSSCATTAQCRLGTISQGCSGGVRRCCTVETTSPPPVTTGGGSIGGNPVCVVAGVQRRDIAAGDCREAQTTGCIKRLLTPVQYRNCIVAQNKGSYPGCYVGGVWRTDIARQDCREAQLTGCIRRLLTAAQYQACRAAQRRS